MIVDIALTIPQRAFVFSSAEHPAIVGGLGSGKTRAGTLRTVILLIQDRGINVGIFLPSYDLLRLRAMPGVEDDLTSLGLAYTVNKSNFTISVAGYGDIIFRSYGSPERIISFEIGHAIVDELDTLSKEKAEIVWRKISERVRQKCRIPNTISVVTTPDQGVTGFVYEKWVKKAATGYELIKASTRSNPYLPEGYIDQIIENYDPVLAQLYIDGDFVSLNQNKVYHFFNRDKHHTTRELTDSDRVIHIGLDFNIGGCCAVVFIIENNKPIAVDEYVSHDTQDFINNLAKYKSKKIIVYPDASGASRRTNASNSDIGMIKSAGFQVNVNHQNPAIRDRINAYNALLAHDKFLINTDKCPNLTNALETQGYDKKGDPEKFDVHPALDDWTDCSGYFVAYRFPIIRNIATKQSMT